jgi:membrane associated rhomboid family serine protease
LFKLGHIFVPFLLLVVGFAAIYSAANYFLVITTGWLPLDRNLVNGWLPGVLGLALTHVVLSPRLHALKPDKDGDTPYAYFFAAAAVVIAPVCLGQYWLSAEAGRLVHVDRTEMIASAPQAAYYTASSVCADRDHPVVTEHSELSGKHNEDLDFHLYVLVPICASAKPNVWIGLRYNGSTDSGASDAVKEAKYKAFAEKSEKEFDALDFAKVTYFESLGHTTDRRVYEKALVKRGFVTPAAPIILIPHQAPFESRGGSKLEWAMRLFGGGAVVFLLMLLFRGLDPERMEESRLPKSARKPHKSAFLQIFVPRRDMYGLPVLLDLNLGVYAAMVFAGLGVVSFQTDDLLAWGAINGPVTHGAGLYRLITSQFVHGGVMHILSNMYGLLFGGLLLGSVLRKWGLILAYLFCGLAGSAATLITHPTHVTVGASGAIMGLFGVLTVLAVLGDPRVAGARVAILANCVLFAGFTLYLGAAMPGIDNSAHVAGFVAGLALGLAIYAFPWGAPLEHEVEPDAGEDVGESVAPPTPE